MCLHLHASNATASLTVAKHYGLHKIVLHSILRDEFDALKSTQENIRLEQTMPLMQWHYR